MSHVRLSDRAAASGGINAIARVRRELADAGIPVANLSDSNPTRHGLLHPGVLVAVKKAVYDVSRYDPHPRGPIAAREALASRFGGSPDDYWLTSSTSQAYAWLITVLADPGETVAVPAPGYPLIPPIARFTGVGTADYRSHYVHRDGWILDQASLQAATRRPDVRAVVAVNPGNPTGAYLGAARGALVDEAARYDCAVISDEVFAPFAMEGAGESLGGDKRAVTFTLNGLSKLLCAPQLKLGWIRLSGPAAEIPEIRDRLDRIADAFLPVSGPIAAGLPELLAFADESVAATRSRLRTNLTAAHRILDGGPYRVRRCDGGWTVVLDAPAYVPSEDLVIHVLRTAHLAVHPGWFYDLAGEGTLAVSLLPAPEQFAAQLMLLRDTIDGLADQPGAP